MKNFRRWNTIKKNQKKHPKKDSDISKFEKKNVAQVVDQKEEEQLFLAFYFATSDSSGKWLVDNGCTNHKTFDHDFFKELDTLVASKVNIGTLRDAPNPGVR